jgi:hypothetical protein
MSPSEALDYVGKATFSPRNDLNLVHGRVMLLEYLIKNVVDWSKAELSDRTAVEQVLLEGLHRHTEKPCPLIIQRLLECINQYLVQTNATSSKLRDEALRVSEGLTLSSGSKENIPGTTLAAKNVIDLILTYRPSVASALHFLGSQASEDEVLAVLKRLTDWPGQLDGAVFGRVLELATAHLTAPAVQTAALDVFIDVLSSDKVAREVLQAMSISKRQDLVRRIQVLYQRTRCVPLKEVALPALGRTLVWVGTRFLF